MEVVHNNPKQLAARRKVSEATPERGRSEGRSHPPVRPEPVEGPINTP